MFSYLITFHMNNSQSYRSIIIGSELEDVKRQVHEKMDANHCFYHFDMKDNKNITFTVIANNVSIIEYEMLAAEPILEFDSLYHLDEETIKIVLNHIPNFIVLSIALLHTKNELLTKFLSCMSDTRKKEAKKIIDLGLGKIKMDDVIQAQLQIVDLVTELNDKGLIDIRAEQ